MFSNWFQKTTAGEQPGRFAFENQQDVGWATAKCRRRHVIRSTDGLAEINRNVATSRMASPDAARATARHALRFCVRRPRVREPVSAISALPEERLAGRANLRALPDRCLATSAYVGTRVARFVEGPDTETR